MMVNRFCYIIACSFALPLLYGCNYFFGQDGIFPNIAEQYLQHDPEETMPLAVPEDMQMTASADRYTIPDTDQYVALPKQFELSRPQKLPINSATLRIQKLKGQQWLLIGRPPNQVWPRLRDFIASHSKIVLNKIDTYGTLEITVRTTEEETIHYRLTIQTGLQRNSTELHINRMAAKGTQSTAPQPSSDEQTDDPTAVTILQAIAQEFIDTPQTTGISLFAHNKIDRAFKMTLVQHTEGAPAIRLLLDYERAWGALGLALKKTDYKVVDRRYDLGIYYITYDHNKEDQEKEARTEEVNADEISIIIERNDEKKLFIIVKHASLNLHEKRAILQNIINNMS